MSENIGEDTADNTGCISTDAEVWFPLARSPSPNGQTTLPDFFAATKHSTGMLQDQNLGGAEQLRKNGGCGENQDLEHGQAHVSNGDHEAVQQTVLSEVSEGQAMNVGHEVVPEGHQSADLAQQPMVQQTISVDAAKMCTGLTIYGRDETLTHYKAFHSQCLGYASQDKKLCSFCFKLKTVVGKVNTSTQRPFDPAALPYLHYPRTGKKAIKGKNPEQIFEIVTGSLAGISYPVIIKSGSLPLTR